MDISFENNLKIFESLSFENNNSNIVGLLNWRGEYTATTAYNKNDLVKNPDNSCIFITISGLSGSNGETGIPLSDPTKFEEIFCYLPTSSNNINVFAGEGLSGGGNLSGNIDLSLDISELTEDISPIGTENFLPVFNTSTSEHKKVLINNLPNTYISRVIDVYYNPTSELILTNSYQNIPMNIQRTIDSDFSHTPPSAEITFNTSGRYLVIARCTTYITIGNTRSQSLMKLQINTGSGFVDLDGTLGAMYNREVNEGQSTACISLIKTFNNGDRIKMQAILQFGNANVAVLSEGTGITINNV